MRQILCILVSFCVIHSSFAQIEPSPASPKPFNKGKIVLNFGYEKQPGSGLRGEAPKICFSAGYGFTDWCVAGLYANYGSDFMGYHAYSTSGKDENGAPISLYWLEFNSNYLEYGTHAEFHPVNLMLPQFYFVDVYAIVRVGMHHFICDIISETGYDEVHETESGSLKNSEWVLQRPLRKVFTSILLQAFMSSLSMQSLSCPSVTRPVKVGSLQEKW